ncbi:hypothetical protein METBIDRAFT_29664 [Metschnikowia bicuspidata var. bicuspidata NRRL YB-4993]|uniref:Uncharacterized protein n=1 Tax=Metschnikowia bicuspidata var. bicuspidata NRRL YB-4993 TaxID=869754 RepID=A0A1A0HGK7_9ASCO|nr:hypothetical protein METBIDRAFT_29664 [Metschnikowia bicuspidata var. bicuspidata NRRL YB-4993]OBA23136.1 hypothetical protein METBIDRAFT_29664 [Metschnikowia bicuspidata var. bicuspidata NRRL YB-4993]
MAERALGLLLYSVLGPNTKSCFVEKSGAMALAAAKQCLFRHRTGVVVPYQCGQDGCKQQSELFCAVMDRSVGCENCGAQT